MSTSNSPTKVEISPEITPIPLMQLATAFWAFKTLATAVDMALFTHLSTSAMNAQETARWFNIEERPAEMLLTGCAGLGLLERDNQDGRYRNSPLAETFLVRDACYYFGGFVTMLNQRLYPGWDKLPDAVRSNKPTTWDPGKQKSLFEGADPAMMGTFWQAMHSLSTFTARALGEAVDFAGFRKLLDVGGGSGAFDIELCRRYTNLSATVYDLPFVTEMAAKNIAEAGIGSRISTRPGDFFRDSKFPDDHDVVLLSMIMHDWSEAENRAILRKCFTAVPRQNSGSTELHPFNNVYRPVRKLLISKSVIILARDRIPKPNVRREIKTRSDDYYLTPFDYSRFRLRRHTADERPPIGECISRRIRDVFDR